MTLNEAIKQLHELRIAEDMPIYYKPIIAEVINVLLMDTQEVHHGRWLKYEFGNEHWHKCSVCGKADEYINNLGLVAVRNYCPNCGADMRGEEDADKITK